MNFYDALTEIIQREEMTQSEVLDKVGLHYSFISNSKARGSIPQVDTAAKLLNASNYKLYAISSIDDVPDSALEITNESEKEKQERIKKRAKKLEEQARKLHEQIKE